MALCVVFAAGGCASNSEPGDRPVSQVEMRNLQTRLYDTTDTKLVMKAVLNVLQDIGLIVRTADVELGLLTAEKWSDIDHSKKEIRHARKNESPLSKSLVLECTANVSEHGSQCRVRVTFQQKILAVTGGVLEASVVDDAAFYQQFFAKVDKGVFLQKEGV